MNNFSSRLRFGYSTKRRVRNQSGERFKNLDSNAIGSVNKQACLSRTYQIQSDLVKLSSLEEKLRAYIKARNYMKVKEIFGKDNINKNSRDENGDSFLNLAVRCNFKKAVVFFIEEGLDINSQNIFLNTPLHTALYLQHYDLADILLFKGSDEYIVNQKGLNAYQYSHQRQIELNAEFHA